MNNYFGTDGIRFIYQEKTQELIYKLSKALSLFYKDKKIIIGHDTRFSSRDILLILTSQLENVIYVGNISTPGICYLSKKHKSIGIMITASHNPYIYNGIKIFEKGYKLKNKKQIKLSSLIEQIPFKEFKVKQLPLNRNIFNEYILFLKKYLVKSNFSYAFDLANGATSSYFEELSKLINVNNKIYFSSPDGKNINNGCGAISPTSLQNILKKEDIQYGFCFDGDADRLILVSKEKIYSGDELLYIFAKYQKVKKVVITKITNRGLIESLKKINIKTKEVDVGDQNILLYLKKHHLTLGGESSGHLIDYNLLPTGDAVLNALMLIQLLNTYSLSTLLEGYIPYQEELISLSLNHQETINNSLINNLIIELKNKFNIYINIRKSGTENKIRIYLCHQQKNILSYCKKKIITYLKLIDNEIEFNSLEVEIDQNSTFGKNICLIGNTIIHNSFIGDNNIINNSSIEDSSIGNNNIIGPYSRIRNNTKIHNNIRIGNFVEIKKSEINDETKIAHLTYIGDCKCGKNVNFGCGTVICNYDGKHKYLTEIGNKVFIGCNTNLIAPIKIENNCFIAAGSTLTTSLKENCFAIARAKQINKNGEAKKYPYFQEE